MVETRVTWLHRLVGYVGAAYLWFVHLTSFVRRVDHPYATEIRRKRLPAIYAFWHNNQVYLAFDHRHEPIHMLVSQSQDGEFIAQVLERMGIVTIRGSTSKGGTQALRQICQRLKDGFQSGFTPDGPKGPSQTVHGGLVAAARISGRPIVPIAVSARKKLVFNSWDKFFVPLPFNSIAVAHGRPLVIPREETDGAAEEKIRTALNEVVDIAQAGERTMPTWGGGLLGEALFVFYTALSHILIPVLFPLLILVFGFSRTFCFFRERFSFSRRESSLRKKLWFHLASYGEWQALFPIYQKLKSLNKFEFLITTNAPEARRLIAEKEPSADVRMAPVDLIGVVGRWVAQACPDVLFLVEKEFWPRLLRIVQQCFIPIVIINGRFSDRAVKKWGFMGPLTRALFVLPSWFFVRTKQDSDNFVRFGVLPDRTTITGNTKYDTLVILDEATRRQKRQSLVGLDPNDICVIGGSTWQGEEEALLNVSHRLILAPRRMARVEDVKNLIQKSGRPWSLWSEVKKNGRWATAVLLVDTLGDLKDLYACADVAFVGGSLIAYGGQSPLEPAAAGLPVVFGPSMENFHEESEDLLKMGGAARVSNAGDLKILLEKLIQNPIRRLDMGKHAQDVIRKKQGASHSVVETLIEQLGLANG